jgi:hypothetical protein
MLRLTIVVALALQLFGCIAPANAFVICISNDGCVELEPSVPGASRCAEDVCEQAHGDLSHACHDIPIFVDAGGPGRGIVANGAPVLIAQASPPAIDLTTSAWLPRSRGAAVRAPAPPRTIVLQL